MTITRADFTKFENRIKILDDDTFSSKDFQTLRVLVYSDLEIIGSHCEQNGNGKIAVYLHFKLNREAYNILLSLYHKTYRVGLLHPFELAERLLRQKFDEIKTRFEIQQHAMDRRLENEGRDGKR